ncbi:MAG: hypothetical protein ACI89X_000795 [Planctomycetota bacterium]|jgi:hypothetical protein
MMRQPISSATCNTSTDKHIPIVARGGMTLLGRAALLLFALSLGSCTFLADEFTWLNRAGPVAEPQDQPPSPVVDRG